MADRDGRLRENQRTFRAANERINELAQVTDGQLVPFLCECAGRKELPRTTLPTPGGQPTAQRRRCLDGSFGRARGALDAPS